MEEQKNWGPSLYSKGLAFKYYSGQVPILFHLLSFFYSYLASTLYVCFSQLNNSVLISKQKRNNSKTG